MPSEVMVLPQPLSPTMHERLAAADMEIDIADRAQRSAGRIDRDRQPFDAEDWLRLRLNFGLRAR